MDVQKLGCDLLTFNGSKIGGPRGVGVLFVRRGIKLVPMVVGGTQEQGLRAGTENVPAIMGLARALDNVSQKEKGRIEKLSRRLIEGIQQGVPDSKLNGLCGSGRLPNNIHISIPYVTSEELLLELDRRGISAGSGSACTSHSVEPSHVLRAMNVREPYLSGALRFTLGRETRPSDVKFLIDVLPGIVEKIRRRRRKGN
jgi:cysteine desulfurase